MDNQGNTAKRHRRKKVDLEQDLFNAANKIISKYGFTGLTMSRLMREAKAENAVFYNRYRDMNDFLDKFVRKYDYWLNDSLVFDPESANHLDNVKSVMIGLIDSLLENAPMQKLLAWEMNEDNFITRRTAQNRDNNSEALINYFEQGFKDCIINFNVSTALLLGGIYYLIIHRKLAPFNRVDYNTKEGIDLLKKNITLIAERIFQDYDNDFHTIQIAKSLIKNNVEYKIVKESTGLSDQLLETLYKESNIKE